MYDQVPLLTRALYSRSMASLHPRYSHASAKDERTFGSTRFFLEAQHLRGIVARTSALVSIASDSALRAISHSYSTSLPILSIMASIPGSMSSLKTLKSVRLTEYIFFV